jgi:hypothetical protein
MEPNIPEILKTTAKNMSEMFLQIAAHIEKIEAENRELKMKLQEFDDDMK